PGNENSEAEADDEMAGGPVANPDGKAKPTPKAPTPPAPEIPPEFQTWLSDSWMGDWLASDPPLASTDLRPYFFFSRDTLGPLGASIRRLSPAAQEALNHMLHDSDAQRAVAIKNAAKLSPSDAAAVFEALVAQMERQDDLGAEKSVLWKAFQWAET